MDGKFEHDVDRGGIHFADDDSGAVAVGVADVALAAVFVAVVDVPCD